MPANSKISRSIGVDGVEEITMETQEFVLEPLSDKPYLPNSRVVFQGAPWSPADLEQRESRIKRNFTKPQKGSKTKVLLGLLATLVVAAVVYKTFFT
jgi:hypothetical protein